MDTENRRDFGEGWRRLNAAMHDAAEACERLKWALAESRARQEADRLAAKAKRARRGS